MNQSIGRKYPLTTLYFYLTEGCNLACRHCWLAPKLQDANHHYPMLAPELFQKIIAQAKPLGLTGVKLTGGEPLMHPHIGELLDHLLAENLGLTIETNGLLCTPELAAKIAAFKNRHVAVSLDGVDAETHEWVRGVKGAFAKTLTGIENLVKVGIRPQIIMSVMARNQEQIEPMVRLAEKLGCGSVKFNLIQPTARGERIYASHQGLEIAEYVRLGTWVENVLAKDSKIKLYYDHPPAFRPLSRLFGEGGDGCSVCGILSILGVLADGSYALCGIGTNVPELIFGHPNRDELEHIWHTHPVLNELRDHLADKLEGICSICAMKYRCRGSCVAQNYYRTHKLTAPYWYCEWSDKQGLFPLTRKLAPKVRASLKEGDKS